MPYRPPSGLVEALAPLERHNVFHEDRGCPAIARPDLLVVVDRPGRCRQWRECVTRTVAAQMVTDDAVPV